MCDACDAMLTTRRADPGMTFKSFADNAKWRATEYSDEDLQTQYSWLVRGFGHAQAFRDELHLLPGGITKFVVANTVRFWEKSGLLAAWALGRELDHHHPLDALWDDYSAWLKRKGFRHRCGRSFFPHKYLNIEAGAQPEVASWVAAEHVKSLRILPEGGFVLD